MENQEDQERQSFENALQRLEEIVTKLEDESIALEDSINLYEEGVKLSKYCSKILEDAELRIEEVNKEHDLTSDTDKDDQNGSWK